MSSAGGLRNSGVSLLAWVKSRQCTHECYSLLAKNRQVSLAASAFLIIHIKIFNSSYIKRQKWLLNRINFGTIVIFLLVFFHYFTLLFWDTYVQTQNSWHNTGNQLVCHRLNRLGSTFLFRLSQDIFFSSGMRNSANHSGRMTCYVKKIFRLWFQWNSNSFPTNKCAVD